MARQQLHEHLHDHTRRHPHAANRFVTVQHSHPHGHGVLHDPHRSSLGFHGHHHTRDEDEELRQQALGVFRHARL